MGRHRGLNDSAQPVQIEGIKADQLLLHLLLDRQRRGVAVAFTQADIAGVALDLNDRAQREGFVDTAGVEQRRVAKRDRGDGNADDFQETAPRGFERQA